MAVYSRKQYESGQLEQSVAQVPSESQVKDNEAALPELPEPEEIPRKRKSKPDDKWHHLQHPDSTDSMPISAKIEINGQTIEIDRGRIEIQDLEIKDELVKRGYRYMNEEF